MPGRCTRDARLVTLALALSLPACRQVLGIPDDTAPACDSFTYAGDGGAGGCASCAKANCCAQLSNCAADKEGCLTYESCIAGCSGEPACRAACTADSYAIADRSSVSELSACLASNCETACGLACGGVAAYVTEAPSAAACQGRIIQSAGACDHARAWASSPDGDAFWRCVMNATTPDARDACAKAHPAGKALFDTFQTDYSTTCASDCRFGNYWACVGNVSWPKPSPSALLDGGNMASVQFAFSVFDILGTTTIPGATISICQSCPCPGAGNVAWWDGGTNDAGVASGNETYGLMPMSGFGLDGCMEVTSPDAGLVPTFCYWGYPLSESTAGAAGIEGCRVETEAQASAIAAAVPYTLDDTRSFAVAATVFDCLGFPAPNVSLALNAPLDPNSYPFYGFTPSNLQLTATDETGIGGFLNVPIGANVDGGGTSGQGGVIITATPIGPDGGPRRPSSTRSVAIRPGTVTEVMMFPTPSKPPY